MSIDPSLKNSNKLSGRRNVLSRAERVFKMQEEGTFDPDNDSPFGLPKYRVIQSKAGAKKKEEKAEQEELVEGEGAEAAAETEGDASSSEE